MSQAPPDDAASQLMRRLGGKWVVQALATAAELRIPEALDQPATAAELAGRLGCEPSALLRLLRVLAAEGILEEDHSERFELTALGQQLRAENLGTLARFVGSPSQWSPWVELTHAVRTGSSAFEKHHGLPLFEYLARHPDDARLYDEAVDAFTRVQAKALAELDLVGQIDTLVDVGGGRGTLLAELLRYRPRLKGVLFDRLHVVEAARQRFEREGLVDRCTFTGGDFFEAVPEGADAYVIKHVLHNWDDARASAILKRCAAAVTSGGRVLIIEAILLPGSVPDGARLLDLEMLALTDGGRERSKPELRKLIAGAGLKLTSTARLSDGAWLLEAKPR